MPRQSLIWTTLPNDINHDDRTLRLSVLLSPRLDPEAAPATLASFFPDWEDWPATLAQARFEIHYNGGTVSVPGAQIAGPNRIDTSIGAPDSSVWRALFNAQTPVNAFQFKDLSADQVVSFDAASLDTAVRDLYSRLARTAADQMPRISDVLEDPAWHDLMSAVSSLDRRFTNEKTGLRDAHYQFNSFRSGELKNQPPLLRTLGLFQLFHTPPTRPVEVTRARPEDARIQATYIGRERTPLPTAAQLADKIDFHHIVAAMNSYPTLLRRLGLVIDFALDPASFTRSNDAPLSTEVHFAQQALTIPKTRDASPVTHAQLTNRVFRAVSNPAPPVGTARVRDRLLDLDPYRFSLLQIDVDSAGQKLIGFARSMRRMLPEEDRVDPVTRHENELGAPSLRTAGLMLVQHDRGTALEGRLQDSTAWNSQAQAIFATPQNAPSPSAPTLWAEDLVRGFRFDVWDERTGVWRSLCRRNATYELQNGQVIVTPAAGEEEGVVRLAATKSADPASNADLVFLHEAVVSWTGWSLTAPPPGRAVLPDDSVDKTRPSTEPELPPGIEFRSRYSPVPRSLPRLRFGRRYWLRARAVDLAGNSLLPQEADFGNEDPTHRATPFLRYEPVVPPVIALVKDAGGVTHEPAEGESMQQLAIRTFNNVYNDPAPSNEVAHRVAVSPQASVKDAELHGMLDQGGRVDDSTFNLLANQKDKDANDPTAALVLEELSLQGPLTPTGGTATYAVYKDGQSLTYLPDPLALAVAARIFGHPGVPDGTIITIPLYPAGGDWPDAVPFRVELFESAGGVPTFDDSTRTLQVPVAKGERVKVRLSMVISKRALYEQMGIWRMLTDAEQTAREHLALRGQHWMLTPWRTLDLVHAVQRPLIEPEITQSYISRSRNATSAVPSLLATCSIKSTDRVDLKAEWHEPSDDPSAPVSEAAAIDRHRGDTAFSIKITNPNSYAKRSSANPQGGIPDHSIEATDRIGINWAKRDFQNRKHHEFHDTRYRRIAYWFEGTTSFREYMPPSVLIKPGTDPLETTEEKIKVVGPRTVAWIPSSAPPPAPEILYIVPTFGWARSKNAQGDDLSWRRGGGLRVYLDRPWNVTGYGEMLAVVLPPPSFTGNPDELPKGRPYKNYVTQWGNDPIWESPFVSGLAPKRANFTLARTAPDPSGAWLPAAAPATEKDQPPGPFQVTGLLPAGVADPYGAGQIEIAPHDVFYDPEQRLWFCDIEINQGASYWPFIRLALARYQPVSVSGVHLSSAVLADFMALPSDRWLTVKRTQAARTRHLTVFGRSYTDSSGNKEASAAPSMSLIDVLNNTVRTLTPAKVSTTTVVEVWVETLDTTRGEDFGWVAVPGAAVHRNMPGQGGRHLATFEPAERISLVNELRVARRFDRVLAENLIDHLVYFPPLWDGTVTLPENPDEGRRYRLVIAEFEEYLTDDDRPYDPVPTTKGRRMVFVEHVELT